MRIRSSVILLTYILLFSCTEHNEVTSKTVKNKTENNQSSFQELSQKEKFLKSKFDFNSLKDKEKKLLSDLMINRPRVTTSNFFLSKNIEFVKKRQLDEEGVLLSKGNYHPTEIAKLAISASKQFAVTKSQHSKNILDNQLSWIKKNFVSNDNYGTWFFPFSSPAYHLEKNWSSGYAHGLLLSASIEGYKLTGNEEYRLIIEKALKMYFVPQDYGGFKIDWNKNEVWYEEYATDKPSRVLNGMIFNLECLYNASQDLKLPLAKYLFEEGVKTVLNHLEDYDAKYSSRYNLADWKNEIAKENYHEIHILQLLWLYKVTGKEKFKIYAKRFLENDRHDFFNTSNHYSLAKKVKNYSTTAVIDSVNYGVENLDNEIWAYGKYWSSYKTAELIINFENKKENIYGLTLYHVSAKSKNVNFEIYRWSEEFSNWVYVEKITPKLNRDKISVYNKTGNFETYIEHFKIHEPLFGEKIKIKFYPDSENVIALRNINLIYDRSNDLNKLLDLVEKKLGSSK